MRTEVFDDVIKYYRHYRPGEEEAAGSTSYQHQLVVCQPAAIPI